MGTLHLAYLDARDSIGADAALVYDLCQTFLADQEGEVVVFRAFLDESGTHDGSPVLTVAGYLARPAAWRKWVPTWRRTLSPIKVFHSTDCNGFHREWEGWSREDRDAKVAQLLPLIPDPDLAGLAIGVVVRDLEKALEERPHLRPYWDGDVYGACLQWWIHSLIDLMNRRGAREPVAIVHEQNDFAAQAMRAFNYVKAHHDPHNLLVSFSFGSKDQFVPLQAADILAYDVGKKLLNIDGKPRRSFEALMPDGREAWIRFYDKKNLGYFLSALEMAKFLDESEALAPAFVRRRT
jgi:hypothetical protein